MLRTRTSQRVALTCVLVLALLAAAAHVLLPPRQTSDIAMPAPEASAEEVVATYLDALAAHDCDTADALWVDSEAKGSWCSDVADLRDIRADTGSTEDPSWSGHRADQEVVSVPVTFDLDRRLFRGDGSMSDGPTTWGYLLVRDSATEPWRITDQGNA